MLDKDEIGKLISTTRKNKNITQQELAQRLHISDKAISNWETGKNLPSIYFIRQIEKILDIKILQELETKTNKKNKIIFCLASGIILLILSITILYCINNYNQFNVYSINVESDNFTIEDSYLTISQNQIILSMQEIVDTNLPYQPKYDIKLSYNLNCSECIIYEKKDYESLIITKNITEQEYNILKKMDLYLIIEYENYSGEKVNDTLKLIFSKEISNNKIFYKKEVHDDNLTIKNLLHNNNYQKISDYEYEKILENERYTYNITNDTLYYKGENNGIVLYGLSNNKSIYYVVFKDYEIIEYQIKGENTGKKYRNIITEKLNELKKLNLSNN